jgi:hypothetical protein
MRVGYHNPVGRVIITNERGERSMRVTVLADKCVASRHCVLQAPAVFDQSEDDGTEE